MIKYKSKYIFKNATEGSCGYDIISNENIILKQNKVEKVSTSLYLELPMNIEAQIRSRSSLASKGIIITNSPGTIDSDYRGEIKVLLLNLNQEDYEIKQGDKIAQIIFAEILHPELILSESLSESVRGDNGFGSTGK